ncbi:lipopolysaccharide biosynthesis protein [Halorientalis sp.]|uniref:lipopolysaccharide biosynthesis protein n=1 Tax=Halorientalis sp. TaxID=1931229 RepID=UPI002608082F|nr:hypothetical protein [Halorientalis sp.]
MSGTTREDTRDSEDDLLVEVVEKASVGVVAFGVERALLVAFSFVVTALSGAVVYGYLSVFVRGETIVKNLVAGIGDGYSRTMARADPSARKSVVTAGLVGIFVTWAVLAGAIVWFRDPLIQLTLLEPRHRSTLLLYALGLLPFVLLRNARDVFRAVRAIRTATLVSHVFRPAALLLGALVGTLVLAADDAVATLWTSVVGATFVGGTVATVLVVRRTGVTLARHRALLGAFFRYVVTASGVAILELVQRRAVFVVMAVVLGPVEAGLFSLSVVFGQLVRWPLSGVNTILPPIAARLYDAGRASSLEGLYQRTARLATVAATPVVLLLVPYHRELLTLFSPAYADAAVVLLLVVIGQYLATTFGSVGLVLLMTDNERASLALQVLNAAVALPTILVLTVRFGVVGLGVSYLVAVLFNNATECCLLYVREGFVPFTRTELLSVGVGFTGLAVAAVATTRLATLPGLVVTGAVVIGYLWVIWTAILSDADKAVITAALGSVVSSSRSP